MTYCAISFRTTYAPFPVFFVILASDPLGRFLARILPAYKVPLGRFSFSLNPGPWSTKEHAIVGIAANAGSQGQWASKEFSCYCLYQTNARSVSAYKRCLVL